MGADHKLLIGLACTLLLASVAHTNAESECDAVLKKEQVRTDIRSSNRTQATRNFICSHDFEEFKDSYGGSASGQYYLIGGSGEYNQGNYKEFQHDRCSDATNSEHESGFQYYTLRDASAGAISSWQQCMATLGGFGCWAEPENQDIAIVLNLREPGSFTIKDATISEGATLRSSKTERGETQRYRSALR
jgi:hypothetical protein